MKNRVLCFVASMLLVFGLLGPAPVAQAEPVQSNQLSPAPYLNPDGTLKLDGQIKGTLNLSGWNVQIDPQRGPVFDAMPNDEDSPTVTGSASAGPWANLGTGGPALNGTVFAIAISGNNVYLGGSFTNADNIPAADYVVRWDGTQWSSLGTDENGQGCLNKTVLALAVDVANVYVGGQFTNVVDKSTVLTAADYIAKWNPSAGWSALSDDGSGGGSLNGAVDAIATMDNGIYVGGAFTNVQDGVVLLNAADYVARWYQGHWHALGGTLAGNGSLSGRVYALAADGSGNLYVGGNFTNVSNGFTTLDEADYLAEWGGSSWSALGSNGSGDGAMNNVVYAIALDGSGNLYVGGAFLDAGGIATADHVAEWNGSWNALGSNGSGNGALNNDVQALAVIGANVYAGGWFTDAGNAAGDYIAKWTGVSWANLQSNGLSNGGLNNGVLALAVNGAELIVGGSFTKAYNGSTAAIASVSNAAVWGAGHWASVSGSSTTGSLNSFVNAIAVSGNNVYVGGTFTDVNNHGIVLTAADYIAKWDGANWSALGSDGSGDGALNNGVSAIAVIGTKVYVGGGFSNVYDGGAIDAADYIAMWDGAHWNALSSDALGNGVLNNTVLALTADTSGNLYVGGYFTNLKEGAAYLASSAYIAMWDGAHWNSLVSPGVTNQQINDIVRAIAVYGSNVYIGGDFRDIKQGTTVLPTADYVAKWNGATWSGLGSNGIGDGALNDMVDALAVDSGGTLYIGGDFTNAGGLAAADYIAKWNGTWHALGARSSGDGVLNGSVEALAIDGSGNLYAGGMFTNVNDNLAADYIARWNGVAWLALGSGPSGNGALTSGLNAYVKTITIVSPKLLYAGGFFVDVKNSDGVCPWADFVASFSPIQMYLPLIRAH